MSTIGAVYLVGAGPGDPGLITVRGLELVRAAETIVHDRLIPAELLSEAKQGAEIIAVGKTPQTDSSAAQQEIHAILIDRAKRGLSVVRLKGGDPFVFGRGFEELSACRSAGVPCIVVPGVTSAIAAPEVVGLPITARGLARTLAIVTGSTAGGRAEARGQSTAKVPHLDYAALARMDTLIILMGHARLGEIAASLMAAGRAADTPVACIERATLPDQRIIQATLGTIADAAADARLGPPMVAVVGPAAAEAADPQVGFQRNSEPRASARADVPHPNRHDVAIRHSGRLAGRRILVNREHTKSGRLGQLLRGAGATVIHCPTTQVVFPLSSESDAIVRRLPNYDWLLFTSANGIEGFHRWLVANHQSASLLAKTRIGCVGPATANAAQAAGLRVDLVPPRHDAASLAQALMSATSGQPGHVLFIRGDKALPTFVDHLRMAQPDSRPQGPHAGRHVRVPPTSCACPCPDSKDAAQPAPQGGLTVDELVIYRTEPVRPPARLIERVRQGVDAAVFFSPSAASALIETVGAGAIHCAVCIGQTTANCARRFSLRTVVAKGTQPESLLQAVLVATMSEGAP